MKTVTVTLWAGGQTRATARSIKAEFPRITKSCTRNASMPVIATIKIPNPIITSDFYRICAELDVVGSLRTFYVLTNWHCNYSTIMSIIPTFHLVALSVGCRWRIIESIVPQTLTVVLRLAYTADNLSLVHCRALDKKRQFWPDLRAERASGSSDDIAERTK
jgi:hypothetical protein